MNNLPYKTSSSKGKGVGMIMLRLLQQLIALYCPSPPSPIPKPLTTTLVTWRRTQYAATTPWRRSRRCSGLQETRRYLTGF